MASASCSRLLPSFLIILLALGFFTVDGYQGKTATKRETGKEVSLPESFDGPMAAAYAKVRYFIGGRKMLQGKNNPSDLEKSFQEPIREFDQDHVDFQEKVGVPGVWSEATVKNSGKENVFTKRDDNNDERKAFDEVANLMAKDYKGGGRPGRKPPINNHEPKD